MENSIQNYVWGSKTRLTELFGIANEKRKPQAEIWMGAHEKAPSNVVDGSGSVPLNRLIAERPEAVLGKRANAAYAGRMPFLFKVLSAERPLSVQVHPDAEFAAAGYRQETERNIPLDAPNRNYKDPHHKPELICAITDFQALKGFRPISAIVGFFDFATSSPIGKEFLQLRRYPDAEHFQRFYRAIMRLEPAAKTELIEAFRSQKDQKGKTEWGVFRFLLEKFPSDIGVLSPFLLNSIVLKPGEALHLDAGEPHAYLHGTCIELMANSDNVIRGGLTDKHVDLEELMKVLRFRPQSPRVQRWERKKANGLKTYPSHAGEFMLSVAELSHGDRAISISVHSIEILFCGRGKIHLRDETLDRHLELQRGDSCMIPATTRKYRIEGEGLIYRASVPT